MTVEYEHGVYAREGKRRVFFSCESVDAAIALAIAWHGEAWTRVWRDGEVIAEMRLAD